MEALPAWKTWRRARRQELLAQRAAIDPAERARLQQAIDAQLLAAVHPQRGQVLAIYWPFRGEYDPRHVARVWRDRGVQNALPVVVAPGQPLQFRLWWPGVRTEPGVYGLPIPQGTESVKPDLLLIPPVGFDAQCYRLGHGGGYYDRTLAQWRERPPQRIGVAFEISRMPTIHPQAHDIALDAVVTEAGVFTPLAAR
jgi:5-formyltetrahydrofolate cyclo-ligase